MPSEPPDNPLKLPFFVMGALVGLALIAVGLIAWVGGAWPLCVLGLVLLALALPPIRMMRRGRNAWWMRRRWIDAGRANRAATAAGKTVERFASA